MGDLARDILDWLQQHRPTLFASLEYWIIEPSATRQAWQKTSWRNLPVELRWFDSLSRFARRRVLAAIIFSNELLDAMPVHRLGWDAASRRMVRVGRGASRRTICLAKAAGRASQRLKFGRLKCRPGFADGIQGRVAGRIYHRDLSRWPQPGGASRRSLRRGKLLTIDYGLTAEQFLAPERAQERCAPIIGTMPSADLLANPGEQDLTAHVNFTALQSAGEASGTEDRRIVFPGAIPDTTSPKERGRTNALWPNGPPPHGGNSKRSRIRNIWAGHFAC